MNSTSKDTVPAYTSSEPGAPAQPGGIPLCVPEIRGNEWKYVKECLDTNFVSSVGPFVNRFERMMAERIGARFAVATTTGTAALHVALLVAGVRPDDEVLVSTLTFIAPVNAIRYVGAWPVFIDSEPAHWQMDPARVQDFLERECRAEDGQLRNARTGRRVAAILPVHILGHPVDMDPIVDIARRFGLAVIEDATESLGARYRERNVGALGDVACFSFNGNKIVTTGGGGMLVTDNEAWAARAKYLTTQAKDDPVEFKHHAVGFNYRLTNVQAAIGVAQLEMLDEYIAAKRRIADVYATALGDVPGLTPMREAKWAFSSCWMFTALVNADVYPMDRRRLHERLRASGIDTRPLWQPAHASTAHLDAERRPCPVADRLNAQAISLPSSVGLTAEQQARVIDTVRRA